MKEQQSEKTQQIMKAMRIYQDFPKPGIKFLDIFPIVGNPKILNDVTDIFAKHLQKVTYDKIFMLESRGFLFGVPLSLKVNKPCFPFRKKGKLPGEVVRHKYGLQYGHDQIQIQKISLSPGDKVIIVDDVLATGGTLNAAITLIQQQGGVVQCVLLVNVVQELKGLDKLIIPKQKVFYIYGI